MGWTLIAAIDLSWLDMPLNILKVAVGLGFVIFVHELGHFLVAKLCGVKCEKFYLGFDIAGWKLAKFTWGETEYGIGILPLGGYVKMLGQEDNPARLREELERAKAQAAAGEKPAETSSEAPATAEPPIDLQLAEQALYDPRSYLAKSVPQRMAIISAGVVMNVIFAFLLAMWAFGVGVERIAPVAGAIVPGDGAWQAGVQVGDRILEIGDRPIRDFERLKMAVSLGANENGVPLLLERAGQAEPVRLVAKATATGLAPTVGIGLPFTPVLRGPLPSWSQTPAAQAQPSLEAGDRILAINDTPVSSYAEIIHYLAAHPEQPLTLSIERTPTKTDGSPDTEAKPEPLTVTVAPAPMQGVGLVLPMGPIVAIQDGSPAAAVGLQVGDVIQKLNGEPVGDPVTLPERLRRLTLTQPSARLTIQRGKAEPQEVEVTLRPVESYDILVKKDSPLTAPALGIAYRVGNEVQAVLPDSSAAKAGLQPGMVVQKARLRLPPAKWIKENKLEKLVEELPTEWTTVDQVWACLMDQLQQGMPGMQIDVQLASGEKTLEPAPMEGWYCPERGFLFMPQTFPLQATSFSDAVHLGADETWSSVTMVFRTIQRLADRRVSMKAVSGPVGIAEMAYHSAAAGLPTLLLFLAMLSANLAVLNFLPIPVLDGGHMVFLAYQGITGKPPSERVQLILSYLGLLLLLTLMLWALTLDTGLISRK